MVRAQITAHTNIADIRIFCFQNVNNYLNTPIYEFQESIPIGTTGYYKTFHFTTDTAVLSPGQINGMTLAVESAGSEIGNIAQILSVYLTCEVY